MLVTHDVPRGVPMHRVSSFRLRPEDESNCALTPARLRDAVEATRPSLIVHGHWHWRHGTDLDWPGPDGERRQTRVEGFGANVDRDVGLATGVLDLSDGVARVGAGPPLPE